MTTPPTAPADAPRSGRLPPHLVTGSSPSASNRAQRPRPWPRGMKDGGSGGTRTRDLRLDRPCVGIRKSRMGRRLRRHREIAVIARVLFS
jgi:hypothetical protein